MIKGLGLGISKHADFPQREISETYLKLQKAKEEEEKAKKELDQIRQKAKK